MKYPFHTARITLIATAALLLGACASGPPRPDVDYNAEYNFSQVRSIAFLEDSGTVEGTTPCN